MLGRYRIGLLLIEGAALLSGKSIGRACYLLAKQDSADLTHYEDYGGGAALRRWIEIAEYG